MSDALAAQISQLKELLRQANCRADAAWKATFISLLDGMAASSESSPGDVERRRAPAPVLAAMEAVVAGTSPLVQEAAAAAWLAYRSEHAPASRGHTSEVRGVQPIVARLARCAAGAAGELRQWLGKTADDDTAPAAVAPDQLWSHARDAAPSMLGALLIVEVKKPGNLASAVAQAAKYLRRRIAALFHEADARGESAHDIFALAAATDGDSIALLRMSSGAPADGAFGARSLPCPVLVTAALPLLAGWDLYDAAWVPPMEAPPGFLALVRVLQAPATTLGLGQPLEALNATLDGAAVSLAFAERLGCGGTSDVYALRAAAGDSFSGACVKVPRCATGAIVEQFRREAAALRLLAPLEGASVPRLICEGKREGAAPAHRAQCSWPLLVLAPVGEPLCGYVGRIVARESAAAEAALSAAASGGGGGDGGGSGGAAGAEAAASSASRIALARRRLADLVVRSVLRTLQLAHEHGFVHCDVRPANLVVVAEAGAEEERVLLVDWGLCVEPGAGAAGRGTPAFGASALFQQTSCRARAQHDLTALAHTWIAIAHGSDVCAAPWVAAPLEPLEDTLARRSEWLRSHGEKFEVVRALIDAVVVSYVF